MLVVYSGQFFLGLCVSFLGTIPFGTVNLSVINTTIHRNLKSGLHLAVSASLVEVVHVLLAIQFGKVIVQLLQGNALIHALVIVAFTVIGGIFFFKKARHSHSPTIGKSPSFFLRGAIIGLLNPQAVPFWVVIIAMLQSMDSIRLSTEPLLFFLVGVALGKLLVLFLYGYLSAIIVRRIQKTGKWVNKAIGIIFIGMAIYETVQWALG
ncbi:LysE family transporter [Rapidithrix thailandica]|uniref:LysE family transporter n=1 Tax=Rapidithrix thailandica TaxID=413964 RepID=A0AAW9RVS8_9BACT